MAAHKKRLKKTWLWLRIRHVRFKRWWFKRDHRYGWWWRGANVAVAALVLASIVIPVVQQLIADNSYKLSADALRLVGKPDPTLQQQLTFDGQTQTYQFNKNAIKTDGANPLSQLQAQVGTANGKDKNKSLYALDVPADISKGVTYHDINSSLSFSLVPEFQARQGKVVDGHVVFPLQGSGNQAVYTLKNNGLKEDIVVPRATRSTMRFSYKLNLPKTLEAKALPDDSGGIGIYSGDPTLFGNISYGSDTDRAAVEKARENADKNYLVFGLPSPVIKDTNGTTVGNARFELSGDTLSVIAGGLTGQEGAVTIDPSVVVTATSDLQTGNVEDNIDFDTSGQITRGSLTGGSVGSTWTASTTLITARQGIGAVAYNGYMYVLGGYGGGVSYYNDVQYAPINSSTGALSAWHYTHNSTDDGTTFVAGYTGTRQAPQVAVYNGYLYIMGGYDGSSTYYNDVQYAPLNSNGTVGTWTATSSFTTGKYYFASAVYKNYMYIMGGINNGTASSDVQYAPIDADGTLGAWHYTHNSTDDGTSYVSGLSDARYGLAAIAYNGFLYMLGGNGSSLHNDVQYAQLTSNGTVGAWQTTTSFTTGRYEFGAAVYKGYLYIMGGNSYLNDVQYAAINANGTLGTWATSTSFTTSRQAFQSVAYNGYIYVLAGYNGAYKNDTQYSKINAAGAMGAFGTTTALSASRTAMSSVAYNGYIYLLGGWDGTTYYTEVRYAAINTDGTLGAWNTTTSFSVGRYNATAAVYDGYIYIMAGYHNGTNTACSPVSSLDCSDVQYAPINSDGTIGTWSATTSFMTARFSTSAVAYHGYMYVVGGQAGSLYYNDVQYASINTNGTIGTWHYTADSVNNGSSQVGGFANARSGAAIMTAAGYMYIINGSGGSYFKDSQYAPINADGTIGTWVTTTAPLSSIRDPSFAIVNNFIYIYGGSQSGTYVNTSSYAPINADGTIGTWVAGRTFTSSRSHAGYAAYNNYIYLIGGSAAGYYGDVQYARINNGGSGAAGSWTSSSSFTNARLGHTSVVSNGYIYVMGGTNNSGTQYDDVQYASLSMTGGIGTWHYTHNSTDDGTTYVAGMPDVVSYGAAVVNNGYVYVLGGQGSGSTDSNKTYYAPLNANGTVGTWVTSTAFTTARRQLAAAVYNNNLYVLAGNSGGTFQKDVQYAPINTSTGAVGSWTTATALNTARFGLAAIAYDGYMYALGGFTTNFANTTDVFVSPINSDGSLGSWTATTSFNGIRNSASISAYNGVLYLSGGVGSSPYADVQIASINNNGTVGTWVTTTAFTTARYSASTVIYGGYIYVLGGYDNSSVKNDAQYAPLDTMARTGHYSKLIDLGSSVNVTSITSTAGTSQTNAVTVNYKGAGGNGLFGTLGLASTVSGSGCSGNLKATRYVWVSVTLDDSFGMGTSGSFPDSNASTSLNAFLSDFTINYSLTHPATDSRLRGGATVLKGIQAALDTCSS